MQIVLMLLLAATAPAVPTYEAPFTKDEIKLDGRIDEQWKAAKWSRDFVDVTTGEKAEMRTRVKLMWDEKYLYVAAESEDHDIMATKRQRDAHLWEENAFEIFIDPDNDGENYAEIQINPVNAILDLTVSKPYMVKGRANFDWNIDGIRSSVWVDGTVNDPANNDTKWCAEMAIPLAAFKELGGDAKAGAKWRVEMTRVLGPEGDASRAHWAWAPTGAINFHMPDKWGWVEFTRE